MRAVPTSFWPQCESSGAAHLLLLVGGCLHAVHVCLEDITLDACDRVTGCRRAVARHRSPPCEGAAHAVR